MLDIGFDLQFVRVETPVSVLRARAQTKYLVEQQCVHFQRALDLVLPNSTLWLQLIMRARRHVSKSSSGLRSHDSLLHVSTGRCIQLYISHTRSPTLDFLNLNSASSYMERQRQRPPPTFDAAYAARAAQSVRFGDHSYTLEDRRPPERRHKRR